MSRSLTKVSDVFNQGHLWVGLIEKSEEEYLEYFEQDSIIEEEDVYCQFCNDIGIDYDYDEDFIIIYRLLPQPIHIKEMLIEIPLLNNEEERKVILRCEELGIDTVNTFVFYSETDLTIDKDKTYNGLYYLGEFLAASV